MTARLLVVGDVMTDVVAQVESPLALTTDTPATVVTRQGGAGANVAAWLAHLGLRPTFVGAVGDDPFGREAVDALRAAGVEPRVAVVPGVATGTCVVLVGADGERSMLPDAGAASRLAAGHLPADLWRGGGHLHLSGYVLLNPGSRPAGLAALASARAAGMTTSVDASSAAPLEAVGAQAFLAMTSRVSTVLVTLDEAEVLCGSRDPQVVGARLTAHYGEVVLKLGADGAGWCSAAEPALLRAPAVEPAGALVDTTGAGDAFAAGWLAARWRGTDPSTALRAACTAAAECVGTVGARPSVSR